MHATDALASSNFLVRQGIARTRLVVLAHTAVPLVLLLVWGSVIDSINPRAMTDVGLVSVMPVGAFVLLFLLVVSFVASLARRPLMPVVPLVHVVVLVVMLYGITAFIEDVPRFASAWKFMGIIDYIQGHRASNTHIDAFFNWPGFFAFAVMLLRAAGLHSAMAIAAWCPLVFNLFFLAPLIVIFRWASDDGRVTWLGLWIFYSTNWVAQDYMSNQAMAFTLWLCLLAALLTWFAPRPAGLSIPLRRGHIAALARSLLAPRRVDTQGEPSVAGDRVTRGLVVLLVVASFAAIVTGHQLTPIPVLLTVVALVLFARLRTRTLPLIMIVLFAAWVSYMTTAFLAGNAGALTGSFGQVTQNFHSNVSNHLAGSRGHEAIVTIRFIATFALWLVAGAGVVRRLLGRRYDVAMAVIGGAPFLLPVLQAYGGEVVFRVYLFSLPAVAFFAAALPFATVAHGRSLRTLTAVAVACLCFLGLFQYTRYGNERLDYFTRGDYETVAAFYQLAPPRGSLIYADNENLPWRYRDYSAYNYRLLQYFPEYKQSSPNIPEFAAHLRAAIASYGGGYFIVTRSTEIGEAMLNGRAHLVAAIAAAFQRLPGVEVAYRNRDGTLYVLPPPTAHAAAFTAPSAATPTDRLCPAWVPTAGR